MDIKWNEDLYKRLFNSYDETDDASSCGWIFPNGRMTDYFRGPKLRTCHFVVRFIIGGGHEYKTLERFMRSGAIRQVPQHFAIEMRSRPTDIQCRRIADSLKQWFKGHGQPQVEMVSGETKFFKKYPIGTNPSNIINEIRNFWNEEEKCEEN